MPLGEVSDPGSRRRAVEERAPATIIRRGAIPAVCMDQTPLHGFVAELTRHERFRAFVDALPARARVSEPVLPLVLAALHEDLGRALLVLLPEDADARDAADGAGWLMTTGGGSG